MHIAAKKKAESCPEMVAWYFDSGASLTFGDAYRQSCALAAGLQELGLSAGDVLSFQLPNSPEAVVLSIATSLLGVVVNPVIPIYRSHELTSILKRCGSTAMVVPEIYRNTHHAQLMVDIRSELPALKHIITVGESAPSGTSSYNDLFNSTSFIPPADNDLDSDHLYLFTSGSTGLPKGVVHTQRSLYVALHNTCTAWSVHSGDVMFMPSPCTHITGYVNGIELPLFTGAKTVFMDRWEANRARAAIAQHRATLCVSATPFLEELLNCDAKGLEALRSLRLFACGGAAVSADLMDRANTLLPACDTFRVYGSTEAPLITAGFPSGAKRVENFNADGLPCNWDVKIGDDSHSHPGEILVRGRAMMDRYLDEEHTASAFTADGYFKTGDIGELRKDGALLVTDRLKDIIIRGGENISAREVEDALADFDLIDACAVVSAPHHRLGECVALCAISRDPARVSLDRIAQHLLAKGLARQKCPEKLVLVETFPMTPTGKIKKEVLRKYFDD
nr:AMP-binding protein [Spongiibacter thalassae]